MIRFPPYHDHFDDPTVGRSTHCICHLLRNRPPGGSGRVHCVNRKMLPDQSGTAEPEPSGHDQTEQQPETARVSQRLVFAWLLRLFKRMPQ
jgi:hypothetical protein